MQTLRAHGLGIYLAYTTPILYSTLSGYTTSIGFYGTGVVNIGLVYTLYELIFFIASSLIYKEEEKA